VKHNYQRIDAAATALGAPSSVTVAVGEVIADVREGLLAVAVGTGFQVMATDERRPKLSVRQDERVIAA
jgi:hypothetical protein